MGLHPIEQEILDRFNAIINGHSVNYDELLWAAELIAIACDEGYKPQDFISAFVRVNPRIVPIWEEAYESKT